MINCSRCNNKKCSCNRCNININTNIRSESAGRDGMSAMDIDKFLGLIPQDYTYEQWREWYKNQISGDLSQGLQSQIDSLNNRVTIAETSITQNAQEIQLRATKTETDALGNRLSAAESSISVQAGQIALKVNQTDFDDLGNIVGEQQTQINQNSQEILLKASQTSVDSLGNRVTDAEASLVVQAGQIDLKANSTTVNDLTDRVTANEGTLSVHSTQIASKVSQTEFDTLGNTVANHESRITQNANNINLKVSQTDFDTLNGTVTNHTTQINQNATDITSKATQTSVDALGNRVTTAESSINQNASEIALRVTQGEIESNFSMTPNKIKLFSTEIEMTGKIQFSSLDNSLQNDITIIDGSKIVTGSITADKLDVEILTSKVIQTATTSERTTIGFKPTSTSDPSHLLSKHGLRYYNVDGDISMYLGETDTNRSGFVSYAKFGNDIEKVIEIKPWERSLVFYTNSPETEFISLSTNGLVSRMGSKLELTKSNNSTANEISSFVIDSGGAYSRFFKTSPNASQIGSPTLELGHIQEDSNILFTALDVSRGNVILTDSTGGIKLGSNGTVSNTGYTGVINGAKFVNGICVGSG